MANFNVLAECMAKSEVLPDYRDLDYNSKLEFIGDYRKALKNVKDLLEQTNALLKKLAVNF